MQYSIRVEDFLCQSFSHICWTQFLRSSVTLWLVLFAAIAFSQEDQSADGNTTMRLVSGVVRNESGEPVAGVEIEISSWLAKPQFAAHSDSDGAFEFRHDESKLKAATILATAKNQHMGAMQFPWTLDNLPELVEIIVSPTQVVHVKVVDKMDHPVEGAGVGIRANPAWIRWGETDQDGNVELKVIQDAKIQDVIAVKSGVGCDYVTYVDRNRMANNEPQLQPNLNEVFQLKLTGVKPVQVTLLDADDGKPITNTSIYPWLLNKADQPDSFNLSYHTRWLHSTTDENGVAEFDWLPEWQQSIYQFWANATDYERQRGTYNVVQGDGTLVMKLYKLVPIRGQVTLPDGKPAQGVVVHAHGAGYTHDSFRGADRTDELGQYEIKVAPNQIYLLSIDDNKWNSESHDGFAALPGKPIDGRNFQLRPATRIYGKVTLGAARLPVAEQRIWIYQYGKGLHELANIKLPNPEQSRFGVQPIYVRSLLTDENGQFETFVGSGKYDIRGPRQTKHENFEINQEKDREFNFHSDRPEKGVFEGLVVTPKPFRPAVNARLSGVYRHQLAGIDPVTYTDKQGQFSITRELHRTVFLVENEEKTAGEIVEIGPDDASHIFKLRPYVHARGRLTNPQGKVISDADVRYGIRVHLGDENAPFRNSFGGTVTTNAEGRFTIKNLVPGQKYELSLVTARDPRGFATQWSRLPAVTAEEANPILDLGDLQTDNEPARIVKGEK